jgi:phenylpyruvate tautomerase PptA (4-oxalocrotonate tautomerase family)
MGFYLVAVYYNKKQPQITLITQNNTPRSKKNIAHKTTQTINDTLHTENTIKIQLQLQQIQLQLQLYNINTK